jgi:hypothetical protein
VRRWACVLCVLCDVGRWRCWLGQGKSVMMMMMVSAYRECSCEACEACEACERWAWLVRAVMRLGLVQVVRL